MAVGYCSYENCRWRNLAMECICCDQDMPNDVPTDFVQLTHTIPSRCGETCSNPQMHTSCFRLFQKQLVKMIRSDMSDAEKEKAVWTQKYDMIQKQAHCRCGGKVKPIVLGARDELATSTPRSDGAKTRKKSSKKKAPVFVRARELNFDLNDEDLQQYIWKEPEPEPVAEAVQPEAVPQSFEQCFPELPLGRLVQTRPIQQRTPKQIPPINSRAFKTYHLLSLSSDRSSEWMPRIIGKQGKTLKEVDKRNGTYTSIDENKHTAMIRIFIYNATTEARANVASVLSIRIVKYLSQ